MPERVVTATQKRENIQKIPSSVSAVDNLTLEKGNIKTLADATDNSREKCRLRLSWPNAVAQDLTAILVWFTSTKAVGSDKPIFTGG